MTGREPGPHSYLLVGPGAHEPPGPGVIFAGSLVE
jgi:hypothetical protein